MGLAMPLIRPGRKIVTSILDLAPFNYPGFGNMLVSKAAESAVRNSDRVISISSLTQKDVKERFGVESDMISLGVEPRFRPIAEPDMYDGIGLTIGYVGGFRPSKNPDSLARIINNLDCNGIHDIRVYGNLKELPMELRIKGFMRCYKGFAPDADLPKIYNRFSVMVYPSLFEGFGLPILEAQACGIPVVVYKHSKIPPEVTKFCIKVDNEYDMTDALLRLEHAEYHQTPEHKEYLKRFDWHECAMRTYGIYMEMGL
jgi:glycosyltransferase involved in cell wall biosynthesis